MKECHVEREIGGRMMRMETGVVAKLANAAVLISHADSTVMCTAMRADPRPGLDFFPLQCDYRERTSAAGKFPGGFRKREGAPNEKEVLTMRMIDRPIRPLFPDGFIDEVQVQCWVMSHDGQNDTDVIACTGAAAALHLTDAPFEGPVATVRVGRITTEQGEQFVLNPTQAQMEYSDLDLVLSGHCDGVNMIEVGAAEVPDEEVLKAIEFGYEEGVKPILEMINELREKADAPEKRVGELSLPPEDITEKVKAVAGDEMTTLRKIPGKTERNEAIGALRKKVIDEHFAIPENVSYGEHRAAEDRQRWAREAFRQLEKKTTRRLVVDEQIRADGRDYTSIRPLRIDTGLFARTHGSSLFQRGETQSVVTCTLGTGRDEQIVDGLMPEYAKKFYLHYNFPPFCVGEAGRIMGPGRREIGHGALAERSLLGILPDVEDFPYTVRLVSDITESNGSSSMASVCGGCMALMDAGVPIKNTCAGISCGRFSNDSGKVVHVTDIIGEEDFFGDMDFKISGTREGITGIQLDLKARGLWFDEIKQIFAQCHDGRIWLIEQMEAALNGPRESISQHAPRIIQLTIDPDKIGKLIGPGGKTIRSIQENTGANVDVDDDGTVTISSTDGVSGDKARAEVEAIAAEIRVGSVYEGKVVSTKDFGAFIEIATGTDGMCHISELADGYVKNVEDVVKIGDVIKVKVINVDQTGRIKLSRKAILLDEAEEQGEDAKGKEPVEAS
ncbi:MAG TPA: polyribonucleotide nucleotidyltransferase [Planctomycetaceae bacterium]|nr:polyribonucleotide nucleotidyltransferase [Phycisphaerae bacterium]HAY81309.1 polyribonucleotide nucleotidyltransferase [Planctomycetaceae bacterium]